MPALTVAFAVAWLLFPVALIVAVVLDVLGLRRFALTRALLVIVGVLTLEMTGVIVAAFLWLRFAGPLARHNPRFADANFRLQCWWTTALLGLTRRVYGLRIDVEGQEHAASGPILLLVRHASIGDTLFPSTMVAAAFGIRLRYVLKDELLWDPCLDVVGNRLPNVFVTRGAAPEQDRAAVMKLAHGLGPKDGIALFPEGTRFSQQRRERAIARIAASDRAHLAERAEQLRNTLPPRLTGLLTLLDAAPTSDVVVLAHVGFEGIRRLGDLFNGALIDRTLHVAMWRIRARDIPRDEDARIDWIYSTWQTVDNWVAGTHESDAREEFHRLAA